MATSKFKVGDPVLYNGKRGLDYDKELMGKEGTVIRDNGGVTVDVKWRGCSYGEYGVYRENIGLVATASPIRTVTRREIVPGVYGIVRVFDDKTVHIACAPKHSANELREAARIFNEIADVLDENNKADA